MDEDEFGYSIIRLYSSVTEINLKCNVVQWWIFGLFVVIVQWT